jgi:uncharacterized protein (TIGR03435 family)
MTLKLFAICVLAGIGSAQTPSELPSLETARLAFEAASVKPNNSGNGVSMMNPNRGGSFIARNSSLRGLISAALGVPYAQISGPTWMANQGFDIYAKRPAGARTDDWKPMLQALLEDRFHLQTHRETREESVYFLVLASGVLNAPAFDPTAPNPTPPSVPGGIAMLMTNGRLSQFAASLSHILGRPVVDRTGIDGRFHLMLKYDNRTEPEGPDIFQALRGQLGLKLESGKSLVDILVVDHVDKTPTEN